MRIPLSDNQKGVCTTFGFGKYGNFVPNDTDLYEFIVLENEKFGRTYFLCTFFEFKKEFPIQTSSTTLREVPGLS